MQKSCVAFNRTLRAVETDHAEHWIAGVVATLLLIIWGSWFFLGQVSVYEVADRATLETEAAAHPVATQVDGLIIRSYLVLGKMVKAGELLLELNADTERLALEEAKAYLAGLRVQIQSIYPEIQAEQKGLDAHRKSAELAIGHAKARVIESRAHSKFADQQAESRRILIGKNLVSKEDYRQAQAGAEASHATIKALEFKASGLEQSGLVEAMDRQARIAKLERKLADLKSQVLSQEATVNRLEHDITLRLVLAPTSGYLGRIEQFKVGSVVKAGDVLGAVVPSGKPHAVAFFPVAKSGKLRSGQQAQLRLDAFPWTQYGTLQATVASVGNDPLDNHVRLELDLKVESTPRIPLAHGLSGTAEVEIERLSPAELLFRAVGRKLTTKSSGNKVGVIPTNADHHE